ncbi:hypothetical protein [Streptomyces sp. NPDC005302]|uniref:DUF7336 domain-containing protein n=1 Tax=Streptomyces sp. NPDC005302 TaxID=3154675 RepID=UPI0033B6C11E
MSDTQVVYVVTSGEYSDFTLRGIFLDEVRANQYADEIRRTSDDVEVEKCPAHGPEFVAGRDMSLWTQIDAATGDVMREWGSERSRSANQWDGQCSTYVYSSSLAAGRVLHVTVHTTADIKQAERARKSHAEHVAKKRAEVMGL